MFVAVYWDGGHRPVQIARGSVIELAVALLERGGPVQTARIFECDLVSGRCGEVQEFRDFEWQEVMKFENSDRD